MNPEDAARIYLYCPRTDPELPVAAALKRLLYSEGYHEETGRPVSLLAQLRRFS